MVRSSIMYAVMRIVWYIKISCDTVFDGGVMSLLLEIQQRL